MAFFFENMQAIANRIELIREDITKLKVDAIVNAANSSLMGGGGVDGAIHRVGGPDIISACREIIKRNGSCKTGEAVITTGGLLPAKFVIHTVGPVWNGGKKNEPEKLANCYSNSMKIAIANSLKTIAFPNISTGIYGYPKAQAAEIAIKSVTEFLANDSSIVKVYFVCFDKENYDIYNARM